MKKIITGIAIFLLMVLAFTACQKDNTEPDNKINETQLTPQQIALKKGMQQAAIVIAQISNNRDIQNEVQKLINKGIYNDDYIKFKDLFHPQTNPKLKSVTTTMFAQAFEKVVNSGNYKHLKSTNVYDLEQFLIDNNLTLYVPYPVSDYPENKRTPTVTFNPLNNDSTNIGYVLSGFKSTNSVESVPNVGEGYSEEYPVYVIEPDSIIGSPSEPNTGSGSGSGSGSSSGTGSGHWTIILSSMKITKQYDAFYNGASEIHTVFAKGYQKDAVNNLVGIDAHSEYTFHITRRNIRKKEWVETNQVLDPDWSTDQIKNYLGVVEIDVLYTVKLHAGVTLKVAIPGVGSVDRDASAELTYKSSNGFVGEREFTRDYFFASQNNPVLEGDYGTHDGQTIRAMGPNMRFTTKIIEY